jgi:hypothetical protein
MNRTWQNVPSLIEPVHVTIPIYRDDLNYQPATVSFERSFMVGTIEYVVVGGTYLRAADQVGS